ncbi:hypothetical protein GGI15_004002 [Coemansia interrupta]|uniref:COPII coat assembly protein SEC16 n=1 Tax=Coemansia interrupta TaxID=1126814 RepID=A0A9W8LG29_9FUNG|nr:hypothetical protein GGI15_004002 [Coemansia interrupta]
MFPHNVQRFNMYDSGKASKVAPGMLQIQQLSAIVPAEACSNGNLSLLGVPLLAGETTRAMLIKRRDAAVIGAKAWIEAARASSAPPSDDEIVLYRVIIAMLEAYGSASDSAKPLDMSAVLDVLRSRIKSQPVSAPVQDSAAEVPPISNGNKQQLEQIEYLLLAGNRKEAIDTACRQGLWTHALIIASCTGKDLWQAVVSAYTKSVLSGSHSALGIQYRMFSGLGAGALDDPRPFHGLDQDSKDDEFITAANLGNSSHTRTDPLRQDEPAANGSSTDADGAYGETVTADWARVLSLMLANRTSGDQDAMMLLGDRLKSEGSTVEAHICYALTRQGKAIFTPDSADSRPRAVLLGASETVRATGHGILSFDMAMTRFSHYYRKPSAMFATELYELLYALKTASATESQSSGTGAASPSSNGASATAAAAPASSQHGAKPATLLCLPHLQAYKLYYAWWLVDCGHVALASRYCDAVLGILATLPPGIAVPFISNSLVQELRNLRERLSGAGMTSTKAAEIVGDDSAIGGATSKSWLSRAMPRPSFTSLMTVFDSSIDKFITGADGNRISLEPGATPGKFEVGPDRQTAQSIGGSEQTVHKNPARPLGAVAWDGRTPSPHALAASVSAAGSTDGYLASYSSPRQSMDGRPSISSIHRDSNPEPPRMFTPSNFGLQNEPKPASVQPGQGKARPSTDGPRSSTPSGRPSVDKKGDKADGQADDKAGSGVFGIIKSLWGGRKNQANLGEESNFVYDPALKRWVDKNAQGGHEDVGPPPPPPPSMMKFQPQPQPQQQSMSVPPGMAYGLPPAPASMPGSTGGLAAPPFHANGMTGASRPPSVIPPLANADLSRAGTPGSMFESPSPAMAGGTPAPPPSSGSRQVRRRGARSKYVDLVGQ